MAVSKNSRAYGYKRTLSYIPLCNTCAVTYPVSYPMFLSLLVPGGSVVTYPVSYPSAKEVLLG